MTGAGSPTPTAVRGFTLPRRTRLISRTDFRRVYARGRRLGGRLLVVVCTPRDPTPEHPTHRLGVSVSKDNGPAPKRARIKRLLREAFRLERPHLPGCCDLVLIPRPGVKLRLAELRRELGELMRRLVAGEGNARRAPRRRDGGRPR